MAASHRAHTLSVIRVLRALGPVRRRTRVPRQEQPDLIRGAYYSAIMPFVQPALVEFAKVRAEIVGLLRAERTAEGRADFDPDEPREPAGGPGGGEWTGGGAGGGTGIGVAASPEVAAALGKAQKQRALAAKAKKNPSAYPLGTFEYHSQLAQKHEAKAKALAAKAAPTPPATAPTPAPATPPVTAPATPLTPPSQTPQAPAPSGPQAKAIRMPLAKTKAEISRVKQEFRRRGQNLSDMQAKHMQAPPELKFEGNETFGKGEAEKWGHDHYSAWKSSLSSEENEALVSYSGTGYEKINRSLRRGTGAHPDVAKIDAALAKTPGTPKPMTVFRGADLPPSLIKPGAVFTDRGFTSTSTNRDSLFRGNTQFAISVPKGNKGAYLLQSNKPKEREFLLPHGTSFKIDEVYIANDVRYVKASIVEGKHDGVVVNLDAAVDDEDIITSDCFSWASDEIVFTTVVNDATDRSRQAQALIDRAARKFADAWEPTQLYAVAERFGRRTSAFQKAQLGRQVQAAIGVPLQTIEPASVAKLEGFAARNVDLIKTVPERYFDSIRQQVLDAFESGDYPDTLAEDLVDRDDVAESDAARIARDQIGKLNAQLNQDRQEQLGVTGYIWRTMNDDRVRDEHEEREGEHYDWDSPPEDGHPGEPIQCRCYAEPDFSPLLGDDD